MNGLQWWMRVVGAMYLFLCIAAAILKLPIRAEGPPDTLTRAAAGDSLANFVVDTWFTLGIWFAVLGVALLIASRAPMRALSLFWTIIGWEAAGIVIDIYKVARGYDLAAPVTWMFIHAAVIAAGLFMFRKARSSGRAAGGV